MKKIFAMLLMLCLSVGMVPASAMAEVGGKAIQLGTAAIKDPVATTVSVAATGKNATHYTPTSYVFFGNNNSTPIKWRVLSTNGNGGTYKDADGNDYSGSPLFLLSEYLLASGIQFEASTGNDSDGQTNPNEWQNSDAQAWCAEQTNANFSSLEQSAIVGVSKTDSAETLYGIEWGQSNIDSNKDKLFFLSTQELANYVANYDGAPGMIAKTGEDGSAWFWWLRSPYFRDSKHSSIVYSSGSVYNYPVAKTDCAARPACNLNTDSVLFTSAAKDGKPAYGLSAVKSTDANEWKLTLLDDSRNFEVVDASPVAAMAGDVIALEYTGATLGSNEYISAMITDADGVQYYGRIEETVSQSGMVGVVLPEDISAGNYTLKVFNEQYNGDYETDYASAFCDVELTISAPVPETGDSSMPALWLAMSILSVAGILLLRRKEYGR